MGILCSCISLHSQNPVTALRGNQFPQEKLGNLDSFEYKKYSQSVFYAFSQIRIKPKEYSNYIFEILSKASTLQDEKEPKEIEMNNDLNIFLSPKTSSFLLSYLSNHEDMRSILNELAMRLATIENRSNEIEWDDNLYQGFRSSIKEDKDLQYSFLFSRLLAKNLRIVQYTVHGHYEPEIVPWLLILRNKEKTMDILTDNYINYFIHSSSSSLYSSSMNNDHNENNTEFITDFFFIYNNPKDVLISGHNPMTGVFQPLHLDDEIFKNIEYKDDIISGSYIFIGNVLNVNFQLCHGEKQEENINFSKYII